ncbi:MAG TPA: alpha/beta fold hydrolase [Acidimicrobiales bacterium]|jgi:pimeloyl-ACP methyl ester carboxylesterase|nr:alpha/beta fold hydrolase [Acidimicrobiales bacterium]
MTTTVAPTESTVEVAGLTMRAWEKGIGSPIVVLHPSFGNHWNELHDDLAADHRVLALFLPGFDGTERPDWARHPRDFALLVGAWLREIVRDPVTLVGFEFSGWVAAELATMAPELLDRLVLVGSAGLLPDEGQIFDMMIVSHSEYVRTAFSSPDAYNRLYGGELSDELLLRWDVNRETVARTAWKPYMYNRTLAPMLTATDVPTLLVWGELDRIMPRSCAHRFRDLLPDARLEIVARCGNAVGYERPTELAALIRGFETTD